MINLLLVDDHAMLLEGLARQFGDRKGLKVIGRVGSGKEVLNFLKQQTPDVITLDVSLPDISGINLIPQIKKACPGARILVLTMYDHERYAASAMDAGAEGFLAKGAPFEELDRAVREIHSGHTYLSPDLAKVLQKKKVEKTESSSQLSEREFVVFTALCQGRTLKDVADELGISDKTVSTYRSRLMKKIGVTTDSELIRYAMEKGLIK